METQSIHSRLEEKIRHLEQERDAALERVQELEKNQHTWLAKAGEMGERIRGFNWSQTPLGPIGAWPQPLKAAVGIMLEARSSIVIYWGADLILLYNDAYRALLGEKHPQALGRPAREVFPEVWETIGPLLAQVMSGLGAAEGRNQLFRLNRGDGTEDAWFDFSFNPLTCENGTVGGVFNIAIETTDRVRAEEELRQAIHAQPHRPPIAPSRRLSAPPIRTV